MICSHYYKLIPTFIRNRSHDSQNMLGTRRRDKGYNIFKGIIIFNTIVYNNVGKMYTVSYVVCNKIIHYYMYIF